MLIGSVVEFLLISVLIWRHFDPYESPSCGLTLSEHARVLEGRSGDVLASIPGGIGRRYAQFDCISVWNFTPYPRSGWLDWFSARALRGSTSTDLPSKIDTVAQKIVAGWNSNLVEPRPTAWRRLMLVVALAPKKDIWRQKSSQTRFSLAWFVRRNSIIRPYLSRTPLPLQLSRSCSWSHNILKQIFPAWLTTTFPVRVKVVVSHAWNKSFQHDWRLL